jgi:formylglycine-generating enzyme required for sulfatase activity
MLLALKIKFALVAATLANPITISAITTIVQPSAPQSVSGFAVLKPARLEYRVAGDFSLDGKPASAPLRAVQLSGNLRIMDRQVMAAEYTACADDGGCPRIQRAPDVDDRPMVGVSWRDATAYAQWITRKTGILHRLPTDEEWVFAAGERARNEALPLVDPSNPAEAWIARYDAEASRSKPVALEPQPVGTFGRNEHGLRDVGGNVWEWTNTCFLRVTLTPAGATHVTNTNCGVRVVQGAHRTYMTDFIRDPRTGGCAAGIPPANLGFRLVIENEKLPAIHRMVERAVAKIVGIN